MFFGSCSFAAFGNRHAFRPDQRIRDHEEEASDGLSVISLTPHPEKFYFICGSQSLILRCKLITWSYHSGKNSKNGSWSGEDSVLEKGIAGYW